MSKSAVEVLQAILDNPKDIGNVRSWTSPDVTYVSLNYSNPELKRVMPWCGTAQGGDRQDVRRRRALLDHRGLRAEGRVRFGRACRDVRQLHLSVGQARQAGVDRKCVYLQFMEDTLATTESFRKGGAWTIHSDPDGDEISI
jgi:uncharacterized protein